MFALGAYLSHLIKRLAQPINPPEPNNHPWSSSEKMLEWIKNNPFLEYREQYPLTGRIYNLSEAMHLANTLTRLGYNQQYIETVLYARIDLKVESKQSQPQINCATCQYRNKDSNFLLTLKCAVNPTWNWNDGQCPDWRSNRETT